MTALSHGNCEFRAGETGRLSWADPSQSHGIPQTLRQLFNSSMSPAWRIAQPFCLALGPQVNSPEPIWYVGCKVCDGQEKICECPIPPASSLTERSHLATLAHETKRNETELLIPFTTIFFFLYPSHPVHTQQAGSLICRSLFANLLRYQLPRSLAMDQGNPKCTTSVLCDVRTKPQLLCVCAGARIDMGWHTVGSE